jgi:alpha-ketoglutarate-dependent taurine dioxygenase
MSLSIKDLNVAIGAEVGVDKDSLVAGIHRAELRRLLEARGVLLFRQIHLSDPEQVAVAASLGNVRPEGKDGIFKVSLDPSDPRRAEYLIGSFNWHIDGTHDDVPCLASLLSGRKLSREGGETQFANTYAAYEALPEDEKKAIDGLRVVHTVEASQRAVYPNPTEVQLKGWHSYPPKSHSLVWTHRSGRKSLVLGVHASHVAGVPLAAGRDLIKRLMDWATQEKFVYRHTWTVGDMLIWDNTGTMHRVTPYDVNSGRTMHRTTLLGEEALV